ncbi:septum formation initiator [Corynebacterium ammoniagenes]|uniref:Septum formation initiator n=1 Tax=Corynebacterium ammoniagenes TaxID=1697 RepID=A0AAV5G807_CORAM|nr:septum formation initiator [Corynebacterium ammoniagenes]GJN42415.1 septum formation initiator [Corynebacterium ammoniagenes]
MTQSVNQQHHPNAVNTNWVISLFGTAVGAGILFLPINAGGFGFWPLLIATALIGPMTFLSHRALSRMMSASPTAGADITGVVTNYFGERAGTIISVLYFFAIYPIVLIYGVSITNTVDSFIVNQLGGPEIPRWLLSLLLVGGMTLVFAFGQRLMLIVTQIIVYPLILFLAAVSFYLVPQWDFESFYMAEGTSSGLWAVVMILPVLVFSFNHSPAISQFSLAMQRTWGRDAEKNASKVLGITAVLLTVFTMFFVWSCALAIGGDGLAEAREQNIPVMSYIANTTGVPVMALLSPIVAILAIVSSYFGHALGAAEGARFIVKKLAPGVTSKMSAATITMVVNAFIFLTAWLAAIANPSILSLIESIGGPFIAMILYIMPMYAMYKIPALARFRNRWTTIFVVVTGIATISAAIVGLFL